MNETEKMINQLFQRMDNWRHFPNYQLERRVDLLFSIYLPNVLKNKYRLSIKEPIIPEFPVKIDLIRKNKSGNNHSIKIDYFVIAKKKNETKALLIELKTDNKSVEDEQINNLYNSCKLNLYQLIKGVIEMAPNSSNKRKYLYLLKQLASLNLIEIPNSLKQLVSKTTLHGMSKEQTFKNPDSAIKSEYGSIEPEPVFILPNLNKKNLNKKIDKNIFKIITFDDFLDELAERRDYISNNFKNSLTIWGDTPAGRCS